MLYNKNFINNEEAEKFIDNLSVDDIDIMSLSYFESIDQFVDMVSNIGLEDDILVELYKNFVFPKWVEHWKSLGIETTRKNVEDVYALLQSMDENNMSESIKTINIALNTTHQNGDMLEYLEERTGESNLRGLLDTLSEGTYVEDWNKELRAIGVMGI